MIKNKKAMISIFLALLILPVYSVAIVSIDAIKIFSGKNHLSNSNEIVINSVLSKYDRDLYQKYNLFALDKDKYFLEEYSRDLLMQNIDESYSDVYQAKLVNTNIELLEDSKLVYPENLKKQIIDYMKLKGSYMTGKGIFNLLDMMFESKKYTKVMEKKLDYEDEYSKFNTKMDKLAENLIYYDNNFNKINEYFFDLNKKKNILVSNINNIKTEFEEKQEKDSKDENIQDHENINYLDDKETNKKIKELLNSFVIENESLDTNISIMKVKFDDIIYYLEVLSKDIENIQNKLDEWKDEINKLDKSDIKSNFNSDYSMAKQKFTKENIDSLLNKLQSHNKTLDNMLKTIHHDDILFKPKLDNIEYLKTNNFNFKMNNKLPSLNNFKVYKNIVNNKLNIVVSNEEVKIAKNNKNEIENLSKKYKDVKGVNTKKSIYDFISKEEIHNMNSVINNKYINFDSKNNISNYKNIYNSTAKYIPEKNDGLINKIYLAQYIMEKFNNKFSEDEFSSQIEYILFGNDKLDNNISNTQNLIFGIRFILNSIYAYTSTDLRTEATTIATSISGWTGFGVPLLKSVILGSMAMGESILDVNDLNNRKSVGTYKNKLTWRAAISGMGNWLNKEVKDISSSIIDNIYDLVQDKAEEGIDEVSKNVNDFVAQSMDGITQNIMSEIITPIQTTVIESLGMKDIEIKSNINDVINNIEKNITSVNPIIDSIKEEALTLAKKKVNEIASIDMINEFKSYFINIREDIEDIILLKLDNTNNKFKNNIKNIIKKDKILRKKQVEKYIDEYLSGLGQEKTNNIKGSMSGLSFKYEDYLVAVTVIRLIMDEYNILKRIALVINRDMKEKKSEFDIYKMNTRFYLDTSMDVNTFILKKRINIDNLNNNIIGGY